jgi:hypothetical protein
MNQDQELHNQVVEEELIEEADIETSQVEQLANNIDEIFWEMSHYLQKYMDKGTRSSLKKARVLATKLTKALKEFRKGTRQFI